MLFILFHHNIYYQLQELFFQKLEKRVIMSVHQTHRAMGANL